MNFFKRLFCRHEGKLEHVCDVYGDKISSLPRNTRSVWQCPKCGNYVYKEYLGKDLIYIPDTGVGEVSDGYHTFNELYDHRAKLFATICHDHQDLAWKSLRHDDGSMYNGMFIVGIDTPLGQATYHYDIDPYWDMFKVKELERAPEWDGHTPCDAIQRIYSLRWLKDRGDATHVLYLCDRHACDPCDNTDCYHTYDIHHALNFERVSGSTYLWAEKGGLPMNKHRKAESRRVKSYVRICRAAGCGTSYKKARRHIRKRDRTMRNLPKNIRRGFVRGAKRVNRSMAEAVAGFAKLAVKEYAWWLRATGLVIDEMAFYNDTRPQWPKENPHIPKEVAHD